MKRKQDRDDVEGLGKFVLWNATPDGATAVIQEDEMFAQCAHVPNYLFLFEIF